MDLKEKAAEDYEIAAECYRKTDFRNESNYFNDAIHIWIELKRYDRVEELLDKLFSLENPILCYSDLCVSENEKQLDKKVIKTLSKKFFIFFERKLQNNKNCIQPYTEFIGLCSNPFKVFQHYDIIE